MTERRKKKLKFPFQYCRGLDVNKIFIEIDRIEPRTVVVVVVE